MKKPIGHIAVGIIGMLSMQNAFSMDVETVKDAKDGKTYFCANTKCAGMSTCVGAGNPSCGGQNTCGKEQPHFVGWQNARTKESCEKDGLGKWMLYKPEYSISKGNVAPLAASKKSGKSAGKTDKK